SARGDVGAGRAGATHSPGAARATTGGAGAGRGKGHDDGEQAYAPESEECLSHGRFVLLAMGACHSNYAHGRICATERQGLLWGPAAAAIGRARRQRSASFNFLAAFADAGRRETT